MKKIKFAIIGTGNVTSEHISALQKVEGAELTHIFGRNKSTLKELANKHNILWTTDYN